MPKGFDRLRYSVPERSDDELGQAGIRAVTMRGGADDQSVHTFNSDEAAARFYLGTVLSRDARPVMRGLAAPERPEHAPDMRLASVDRVPHSSDRLARFDQTVDSIPIFGSRVVVHLDANRELIGVFGDVAQVRGVSPIAALSPQDARRRIEKFTRCAADDLKDLKAPELTFFHLDAKATWHLAYHFKSVPAAPPRIEPAKTDHGLSGSPRGDNRYTNYLIDAHDGQVLFFFRSAQALDVPSECSGDDVLGQRKTFWGRQLDGAAGFELSDPLRRLKTFDLQGADLATAALPSTPVASPSSTFDNGHSAAVSAHVNGAHVHDFYKTVLQRDGIDDKKMELISVVNCTYPGREAPPTWRNAVWWNGRMWYGQDAAGDGTLRSFARFLDVIAHELTHGVTQHTAGLVYEGQSGALNESFSDIFGVIIANWIPTHPNRDVSDWTWTIGAGLGADGGPLRDLSDPHATGDPAHMDEFVQTQDDYGGVHTNSNIPNKAAYNLLVATDTAGARVFKPTEVALLLYLALDRLSSLAQFPDLLEAMLDVATIYYSGQPAVLADRTRVIRECYAAVGIAGAD
jgi:Zn-dependent metalloprotease